MAAAFPGGKAVFLCLPPVHRRLASGMAGLACPAGMSGRRYIHAGGDRHKRSVRLKRNRFPQQEAVPNQQFILSREIFLFGDFEGAAHSFRGENGGFIFGCRVVALRCGSKGHFSGAGDGGGMFPSVSQRHGEPGGSRTRRIGVRSGKAAVPRFQRSGGDDFVGDSIMLMTEPVSSVCGGWTPEESDLPELPPQEASRTAQPSVRMGRIIVEEGMKRRVEDCLPGPVGNRGDWNRNAR